MQLLRAAGAVLLAPAVDQLLTTLQGEPCLLSLLLGCRERSSLSEHQFKQNAPPMHVALRLLADQMTRHPSPPSDALMIAALLSPIVCRPAAAAQQTIRILAGARGLSRSRCGLLRINAAGLGLSGSPAGILSKTASSCYALRDRGALKHDALYV